MANGHFSSCSKTHDCLCEVKRYLLIFGIAILILAVEIAGGIISQSLALLADAGHVFTDMSATTISIIVAYYVRCGTNEERTRKIGGYINALLLGCITIWIAIEAIDRFQNPREIGSITMITVAVLGTIGNYIQHKIMESANEEHVTHESMKLHIQSDLLQSMGVVFGGLLIWATDWIIIDPIISIAIALWMGKWTWSLLEKLLSGKYNGNNDHHCHNHRNN